MLRILKAIWEKWEFVQVQIKKLEYFEKDLFTQKWHDITIERLAYLTEYFM